MLFFMKTYSRTQRSIPLALTTPSPLQEHYVRLQFFVWRRPCGSVLRGPPHPFPESTQSRVARNEMRSSQSVDRVTMYGSQQLDSSRAESAGYGPGSCLLLVRWQRE
ncbi:hypothetical protein AOLI_G00066640 [Acnodon oligacanthus]